MTVGEIVLEETADIKITITVTMTEGADVYFDNFVLQKKTTSSGDDAEFDGVLEDFEAGNFAAWTVTAEESVSREVKSNASSAKNTTKYFNVYNGTGSETNFTMTRTVNDVPAGSYSLSYKITSESACGAPGLSVRLKDGETVLVQNACPQVEGWDDWDEVVTNSFTLDEKKNLTIEITGTMPANYWAGLDNIKLVDPVEDGGDEDGDDEEEPETAIPAGIKVDKISNLPEDFIEGVDVSSYISERNSGVVYYDFNGNALDDQGFFNLLADCGVNYVRIRIWNDPYDANGNGYGGGNCDLANAKKIGKWATNAGMKVLIDFHYSDFWTDPGKQYTPKAWKGLSVDDKASALKTYTVNSLTELIDAGVNVRMVQVGNETNAKFCGESDWNSICTLFQAGCEGVREVAAAKYGEVTPGDEILVALHFADPQKAGTYATYASQLNSHSVDYDVFASSYYPFFHGTTSNLTSVLSSIANTYDKKVMVAETSWATTLADGDGHDNQIRKGTNDSDEYNYSFSVYGQAKEVRTVMHAVADVNKTVAGAGIGVFYWEPALIPVQFYDPEADNAGEILAENHDLWEKYGSGWASYYGGSYQTDAATWWGGSAMDNQAMFDFNGHPLESLKVFNYVKTGTYVTDKKVACTVVKDVEFESEDVIVLPETAAVTYTDGTTADLAITWNNTEIAEAKAKGLGTFTMHGTIEETGTSVTCQLTIKATNLLENPSMESSLTDWNCTGPGLACKRDTDNAKTGSNCLHFWYGDANYGYQGTRTVTLDAGVYTIGGYLQGGNADNEDEEKPNNPKFYFSVTVNGETQTVEANVNGYKNWDNPEVENLVITQDDTEVTIKVSAEDLAAGGWGSWDDFYITRQCYNVTFVNGTDKEVRRYECGKAATAPIVNTTRPGYTCLGWDKDFSNITSDMTVTMVYQPISYKITYQLNGGTNHSDNPDTYTVESGAITLKAPSKEGYTFKGWYTDESLTNSFTSIPTGSMGDVTVYAKWVKNIDLVTPVTPTEPTKPTIPTTPVVPSASGTISVTPSSQAGAPAVSIKTESSQLASMLCTAAEQERVAAGTPLNVSMNVANITATVSQREKDLVKNAAKGYNIGEYLDITLYKQLGNDPKTQVTEVNGKLQVGITIPKALLNTDPSVNRTYKMVRIHNDEATLLDSTFNAATGVLTFETDRFSTYAIVYTDSAVPVTGDTTPVAAWAWILVISAAFLIVAFGIYRRKQRLAQTGRQC